MVDARLAPAIWERLISGKPLGGLDIPIVDGRLDLRCLEAPAPQVVRESNTIVVTGVRWQGMDFSNAHLESLRFKGDRSERSSIGRRRSGKEKCLCWRRLF